MGRASRFGLTGIFLLPCILALLGPRTALCAQCVFPSHAKSQSLDVSSILARAAEGAATLPDDFDKADSYQAIARILWKQGDENLASFFFDCAMTVASNSAPDPLIAGMPVRQRSSPFYLKDLLFDRARAGDFSGAMHHVNDIADPKIRNLAAQDISIAASQQGKFELREQMARSIPDLDARDAAFVDLASYSREARQFAFSERITRAIRNDVDRIEALAELGLALDRNDRRREASELFAEALQISESLPSNDDGKHTVGALHLSLVFYNTRDEMLGYVASRQALAGDSSGAEYTQSKISNAAALEETERAITGNAMRERSAETTPEQPVGAPTGGPAHGPKNEEEIVRIEVQNGDEAIAVERAERLETPARVRRLIAIAEALGDSPSSGGQAEH